ncbi:MAG: Glycoprotease family protein [Parcubacteria group bacterium ADurb.Bin316]|mgnify:FL=1|nr:MAG: Glycoprotease family protein [Parcubacteria group bacterium ADurb.Bin316]HOZ56281.1 hypothetical protein [bacterium]
MILYINTIKDQADRIELKIKKNSKILVATTIKARAQQSEKLIPGIRRLLNDQGIDIKEIKKIEVENYGGSFTALRIGVATANALGYALCLPVFGAVGSKKESKDFDVVAPLYNKNPDITISHKKLC